MGPDCYLLLQQEYHHLPEELNRWDLTGIYSCNRSSTTSLRSWTLVDLTATYSCNRSSTTSLRS